MKLSRQTPSEIWGKKDRETDLVCTVWLLVAVWMNFERHLLRKLGKVHGQNDMTPAHLTFHHNTMSINVLLSKSLQLCWAAVVCSHSDTRGSVRSNADARLTVSTVSVHPKGVGWGQGWALYNCLHVGFVMLKQESEKHKAFVQSWHAVQTVVSSMQVRVRQFILRDK